MSESEKSQTIFSTNSAIQAIKIVKKVFPNSSVLVITPDRSEQHKKFIERLKQEKISGNWRISPARARGEN